MINKTLKATPLHPLDTVDQGWMPRDDLKEGLTIKRYDGETKITPFKESMRM